jgi:adenylate kinase family enzyme
MLQSSIKYGLLFGPPGKTTLVKNLSKKFGMIEVDWESTI